MAKLKVCQLVTDLALGGEEAAVCELARGLDPDRFAVRVVAFRGGQAAGRFEAAGVDLTVLDVRGSWDPSTLSRLTDALRAHGTDLLHTHLFHADLAGRPAARLAAVPHVVHTVHTTAGRFRPWQFAYARFLANSCDRIVCVCPTARELHARRSGLPAWRYAVIPDGVGPEAFGRDGAARRALRSDWGVGDECVLVGFLGPLEQERGIDALLGAVSHLGARGDPVEVVIAGDGPRRQAVENFIAHGEGGRHARFAGGPRCRRDLLAAVDVLVAPCRWEVRPLELVEAMAAGVPAIVTDVPGVRDIVVDGQTGLVVRRGDVAALAEAVVRLVRDRALLAALAQAGKAAVKERFTIAATVAAHEALYAEVAGGPPRGRKR